MIAACTPAHKVPVQSGRNTRADVVGSLEQSGIDVKTPVQFEIYLRFRAESGAQRSKRDLMEFCQAVELIAEPSGEDWTCKGRKLLIPDSDETESVLYRAKQSAERNDGQLDSWQIDYGR